MDLLERAYVKASASWNLFTYVIPSGPRHAGDLAHLYLDVFSTFLGTKIFDSSSINKNYSVYSSLYGLDVGYRSEKFPFTDVPIGLEMNFEAMLLSSQSSSVNPDLNFQYVNRQDRYNQYNLSKPLTHPSRPFFHYDVLLSYNTNAGKDTKISQNGSNIFFHFSYYGNLAGRDSKAFSNNYMQFQLGYALDIGKLFPTKSASQ